MDNDGATLDTVAISRDEKEQRRRAELARRVHIARIQAGYGTKEEAAKAAGVDVKTYSALEKGRGNITTRHLWWIADALGVRVAELLVDPSE